MKKIYYGDELYHFGILGMRWGNRRYQNEDGTYTELGKERRRVDRAPLTTEEKQRYIKERSVNRRYNQAVNEERFKPVNDVLNAARNMVDSFGRMGAANRPKKYKPMDLSNKTDQEMRSEINRKRLEDEYTSMFGEEDKRRNAKEFVEDILRNVGPALSASASRVIIIKAIHDMKG